MQTQPLISVVIVNYNVKEYLEQALLSLQRALKKYSHEIFVVDNASVDGSVQYIRKRFPEITLIANAENLGFGRANNVALQKVQGKFVVLINPDTVTQEDTFDKLLEFFEQQQDAGAATCKIINPDGSFSVDCRHSIPTPSIAFWKVIGLSKLFPRSKIFARYNLTYLDPDKTYPVPAISGSFMMIKKEVLDQVGLFDERFFMYCEDIDLCHRINQTPFKIYYVPTTQIIHYKGESTRKDNLDYVITFNKALYQFFQKYYAQHTAFFFRWLITLGIVFRGMFIYLRNFLREHFPLVVDTVILNAVLVVSFIVRFELHRGFYWKDFFGHYWVINLISTIIFLGSGYYLGVYPRHRLSIQSIIKANVVTFTLLASLTFFLKQFAFSRMVVLFSAFGSPLFMILWRAILKKYYRGDRSAWGKDLFSKPTILVGNGRGTAMLYQKIREMKDISYELIGVVTIEENGVEFRKNQIPVLGRMENLEQLIALYRVRQVIFSSEKLSYETILKTMSKISRAHLEYKIAPSNLEVVIGKSSIERLDDYPLLDIEYAIGNPFNRFVKRLFDLTVAGIGFTLGSPVMLPVFLMSRKKLRTVRIGGKEGESLSILQVENSENRSLLNLWLMLWAVVRGKLTLVGAPIEPLNPDQPPARYWHQPGITGLAQINKNKITTEEDMEKYYFFYLKNQSLLLDLEILMRALFKKE